MDRSFYSKILSPDFLLGKTLLFGRAVLGLFPLLVRKPTSEGFRLARLVLEVTPSYTMVAPNRLTRLYEAVRMINSLHLSGDIVECGVWHGGSAAVMAAACRDDDWLGRRMFWLFDSFQGLPAPSEQDGAEERKVYYQGYCTGDVKRVRHILTRQGASEEQIHVISGWFETTLQSAPIKDIALLHIDVDWYHSVKLVLESFYDKVVTRGTIIIDDYGKWQGCRSAVDEFLAAHGLSTRLLTPLTRYSVCMQKPLEEKT